MQPKAAFLFIVSSASATNVTPIQKVITLMTEMKVKAEEEKHAETVAFSSFAQWCKDTQAQRTEAIKQGADSIMQLEADISKAQADCTKLGSEIEDLDQRLDNWKLEMAAALAHRKKEEDVYKAAHQDLSESVFALDQAIEVVKQRSGDVKQSKDEADDVLLQRVAALPRMPLTDGRVLTAFLERTSEGSSNPERSAYEFQSGSVLEMLRGLKAKFEDERLALEKEEISRREAHNMQMADTKANVELGEPQRARKAATKNERTEDAAQGTADLATVRRVKKDDEVFLQDAEVTCQQTSADYEQRQKLRQEELEAIQKAIEIISGDDRIQTGAKRLPQLIQEVRHTSLAQLRRSAAQLRRSTAPSRSQLRAWKAADFFLQQATVAQSEMLAELAEKIRATVAQAPIATTAASATADPETLKQAAAVDDYVAQKKAEAAERLDGPSTWATDTENRAVAGPIKMIRELIADLIEQGEKDATQKEWCDNELALSKQTRDEHSQTVEDLTAKVEEITALQGKQQEKIEDLHEAVGVLTEEMKERTKQRQEEKAENEVTIQEAEAARTAVVSATKVLAEFYAKASTATALLEQPGQTASQAAGNLGFDKPYRGLAGATGGVMGMLDVISSDFARLSAETKTGESAALRDYNTFMYAAKKDKAAKEKDARQTGFELVRTERALKRTKEELDGEQEILDAALAYYDKFKPTCWPKAGPGDSYEERKAKRNQMIQSLKDGLAILEADGKPTDGSEEEEGGEAPPDLPPAAQEAQRDDAIRSAVENAEA